MNFTIAKPKQNECLSKMGMGDEALAISVCREFSLKPDLRFWKFCMRFFFSLQTKNIYSKAEVLLFSAGGMLVFTGRQNIFKISSRLSIGLRSQILSNQADKIFFTLGHFV